MNKVYFESSSEMYKIAKYAHGQTNIDQQKMAKR